MIQHLTEHHQQRNIYTENVLLTIYVAHNAKDFSLCLTLYIFTLNFPKHIIILCALHPPFTYQLRSIKPLEVISNEQVLP